MSRIDFDRFSIRTLLEICEHSALIAILVYISISPENYADRVLCMTGTDVLRFFISFCNQHV